MGWSLLEKGLLFHSIKGNAIWNCDFVCSLTNFLREISLKYLEAMADILGRPTPL